ncbi:MAG TPA: hypothetical protein VMN39_10780, partial [Longimicrobiaceae bacterium]|nr:hypothetical protein [Longimicrobiaceae bacterium]
AFVGVGIGSDFGAPVPIAVAPRFFPVDMHIVAENVGTGFKPSIVAGFRTIATGGPLAGPGGYCYPLSVVSPDSNSKRHVSYPFASPLNPDASFGKSTTSWSRRTLPHDVSFDGVIHIGMIPDFVEELRALRLTDDDLKPLWHGAEAYIRAWESSVAWRGNFVTEDNAGIEAECRALRAELLKHDDGGSLGENVITTTTRWRSALEQIRQKECHGAVP